jgi:hypothetical protein
LCAAFVARAFSQPAARVGTVLVLFVWLAAVDSMGPARVEVGGVDAQFLIVRGRAGSFRRGLGEGAHVAGPFDADRALGSGSVSWRKPCTRVFADAGDETFDHERFAHPTGPGRRDTWRTLRRRLRECGEGRRVRREGGARAIERTSRPMAVAMELVWAMNGTLSVVRDAGCMGVEG